VTVIEQYKRCGDNGAKLSRFTIEKLNAIGFSNAFRRESCNCMFKWIDQTLFDICLITHDVEA